jgi:hypothetical protein
MKTQEIEEIIREAERRYWELIEALKREKPEYLPLYHARYEYLSPNYPIEMRLHNAYEILRAWHHYTQH